MKSLFIYLIITKLSESFLTVFFFRGYSGLFPEHSAIGYRAGHYIDILAAGPGLYRGSIFAGLGKVRKMA